MDLTEEQTKIKLAWQAAEIERLTTENTRFRSALADRQIVLGEMTLKNEAQAEPVPGEVVDDA